MHRIIFHSAIVFLVCFFSSCQDNPQEDAFAPIEDESDFQDIFQQAKSETPALAPFIDQAASEWDRLQSKSSKQGIHLLAGKIGDMLLTNDKIWILRGPVLVASGHRLTIEPGTVIKAFPGQGARSSYLMVEPGAKIIAQGTLEQPIVFTSMADRGYQEDKFVSSIPPGVSGLWGGIIIMGNAPVNSSSGQLNVEGVLQNGSVPTRYGGNDPHDDSGILQYVSIRYSGTEVATSQEINGLTLAGVGDATTIDHVEVISTRDDAFSFYGGTVNTKYLLASFCGDDAFDLDDGVRGFHQFWFAWMDLKGEYACELDGGTDCHTLCSDNFSRPLIVNATFRGAYHEDGTPHSLMRFQQNAGGEIWRSLFYDFQEGIVINATEKNQCGSDERLDAGNIKLVDNLYNLVSDQPIIHYFGQRNDALLEHPYVINQIIDEESQTQSSISKKTSGQKPKENDFGQIDGQTITYTTTFTTSLFERMDELKINDEMHQKARDYFINTRYTGAFEPAQANWAFGWTQWSEVFLKPEGNFGIYTEVSSTDLCIQ